MATVKKQKTQNMWAPKSSKKRPGRHSKKRSSMLKTSKNYRKSYRGQGRP